MKKLTNKEVIDIVENEGLGYAVMDYMSSDRIKDPLIAALWKEASIAMKALEEALKPFYDE